MNITSNRNSLFNLADEPARRVLAEIERELPRCVRQGPAEGIRFRLPHPYTVPCPQGGFNALYYWDTWFTNLALLRLGLVEQARANVDNLLWMLDTFGFVPGNNTFWGLTSTQPPFLALAVRDVYAASGDREWLRRARAGVAAEHAFWMRARSTPCGLNRYGTQYPSDDWRDFWDYTRGRVGLPLGIAESDAKALVPHLRATGESGWDFTPRWALRCADHCPADLNALLYASECFLAESAEWTGANDGAHWREMTESRAEKMRRFCWDEDAGAFLDYNFATGQKDRLLSAAVFFPLWLGVGTPREAEATLARALPRLERAHGLGTCEPAQVAGRYQWAHPNLWPPLQLPAVAGLARHGHKEAARRLAGKYTALVEEVFTRTGRLWEKYHVENGNHAAEGEYAPPPMMGWTAGVYAWCIEHLAGARNT